MSGTIGLALDLAARYSQFWDCLENLRRPVNTQVLMQFGSDRSVSRNALVQRSLDMGSEWILFLDDDHGFRGDLLMLLLAADMPVVGSLLYRALEDWQGVCAPRYYEPAYVRHTGRAASPRLTARAGTTRR